MDQRQKVGARFKAKVIDYRKTFSSEAGQRVLYDLMLEGHMLKPLPMSSPDRDEAEGKRQIVLKILTMLKTDPDKLQKLIEGADAHAAK